MSTPSSEQTPHPNRDRQDDGAPVLRLRGDIGAFDADRAGRPLTADPMVPGAYPALPTWLQEAFDAAPVMVTVTAGPEHRMVWRNQLAVEAFGPVEEGQPLQEAFPDTDAATIDMFDRALRGESLTVARRTVGQPDVAGRRRVLRYSLSPLPGAGPGPAGVIQFVADATSEAEAEHEAARSRLLADVSSALAGAADAGQALQSLTDALIPAVGDLAAVYAYSVAAAGPGQVPAADPVALTTGPALGKLGPPPPAGTPRNQTRWHAELAAGAGLIVPVTPELLTELAVEADERAWLEAAGATCLAVTPLVVAGQLAGAVLLLAAGDRRPYDQSDIDFLAEVTSRAGASITEVRARDRNRQVAERLQRALLPARTPQPPGLAVAARYVPGGADSPVGGDWWDVLEVGAGRVGLGIGDISGHGIGAAALMGQARVAMRAAGRAQLPPAELLALVDNQLSETIDQEWGDGADLHRFATALYGVVDTADRLLRVASAGHLPVLCRAPEGPVEVLHIPPGPPLGLGLGGYQETVFPLQPGSLLVAYTDGLVERRGVDVETGIGHLAEALAGCPPGLGIEGVADRLLRHMARLGGPGGDDLALLVTQLG